MVNNLQKSKRGVVILFAVLLVSVVLTISLGIFNITYRQLVLSSIARESEIAFAVADSARNCAMYWNSSERADHLRPFYYYFLNDDSEWSLSAPQSNNLTCVGQNWNVDNGERISYFQIKMRPDPDNAREACANVVVEKTALPTQKTTITVDGYNLSKDGGNCTPTDLNRAVNRRLVTIING